MLSEFPEEEKWGMQSKLRTRAFEISSDIADALGAIDPRDVKWHFGLARRGLFGLKNVLIQASNAGYVDVETDLLVEIQRLADLIDIEIEKATKNIPSWFKEMERPMEEGKR